MSAGPETFRPPRLLAVSDRRSLPTGLDVETWARQLATDGVPALQVREKDLDDGALFTLVSRLRALFPPPGLLLVNGRADVALAAGADGVHLPAAGLPAAPLRRLAARRGHRLVLGRSTHRVAEVEAAQREGLDYVTFGPVYATPSKAGYGAPPGLGELARAAAVGLPVIALGGVTDAGRVAAAAGAGAAGVAGIRAFQDAAARAALIAAARLLGPGSGSQTFG